MKVKKTNKPQRSPLTHVHTAIPMKITIFLDHNRTRAHAVNNRRDAIQRIWNPNRPQSCARSEKHLVNTSLTWSNTCRTCTRYTRSAQTIRRFGLPTFLRMAAYACAVCSIFNSQIEPLRAETAFAPADVFGRTPFFALNGSILNHQCDLDATQRAFDYTISEWKKSVVLLIVVQYSRLNDQILTNWVARFCCEWQNTIVHVQNTCRPSNRFDDLRTKKERRKTIIFRKYE